MEGGPDSFIILDEDEDIIVLGSHNDHILSYEPGNLKIFQD